MTKVLIVDDSAFDQQIAAACVQHEGCEVLFAGDGKEALAIVVSDKPDIVLTDMQMPKMDGLELVKKLREDFPHLPVILMTGFGSEKVAAEALKAGASSYVPKKNLKQDLSEAMAALLPVVDASEQRNLAQNLLQKSEYRFELGYEGGAQQAVISFLRDALQQLNFCNQSSMLQISTALSECITNALDHGNLELNSKMREAEDNSYRELGDQRAALQPYCDRRVTVTATLTPGEARFVISDEGPGFDPSTLPDPTDPENLIKPHGRGVMLMRTFLDEISFNATGNEVTLVKRRPELSE